MSAVHLPTWLFATFMLAAFGLGLALRRKR
jgi:hypothetical protein